MTIDDLLHDAGYVIATDGEFGGTATVFRAVDLHHRDEVAVKVLGPGIDPERVRREADMLARIDHPAVPPYLDAGTLDDGRFYLVSPWVDGRTLQRLIVEEGPLPTDRALGIFEQLCHVLDHVHSAGIVHRDLSPRNVMVADDDVVTLIDFGLSRAEDSITVTASDTLTGTPRYLAPEVIEGAEPDARADQYGAAVVLYEMLTNTWPYPEGGTLATALHHQLHSSPMPLLERNPSADPRVDAALQRALSKDPAGRFDSMAQLMAGLDGLIEVDDVAPPVAARRQSGIDERQASSSVWPRVRRIGLGAAVTLVVVALAGGAVWLFDRSAPPAISSEAVGDGASTSTTAETDGDAEADGGTAPTEGDTGGLPVGGTGTTATTAADAGAATTASTAPGFTPENGFAAGLACNLLAMRDFESGDIDFNYYYADDDPIPNRVRIVEFGGVDDSSVLQVGVPDGYGLYGEIVEVLPGRSYVLAASGELVGEVSRAAVYVVWLDAEFNQIDDGVPTTEALVVGGGRQWVVNVTDPAPPEANYAVPTLFKDGTSGVLLADELVFGPASGDCGALVPS